MKSNQNYFKVLLLADRYLSAQQSDDDICVGDHFNQNALDAISNIVDRLRRGNHGGCLCPQEDWFKDCVHLPISHVYDPMRAKQDLEEAVRIDGITNSLSMAADALRKIQECILSQAEEGRRQAQALRVRAGFSSLPDEILVTILEYSLQETDPYLNVYEEHGPTVLKVFRSIERLSLTCRRFRYLLTHFSKLWCRLWSGMSAELVFALCGRLTRPVADILIDGNNCLDVGQGCRFRFMVSAVVARADYWSRFTLRDFSSGEMHFIARATHRLHAPYLAHLSVSYPPGTFIESHNESRVLCFFTSWSTPALKSFNVRNLIPSSFAASSTLTSFKMKVDRTLSPRIIDLSERNFDALVSFLASCSNLRTLDLHWLSLGAKEISLVGRHPITLSNVENLELIFAGCKASLIKPFFDIIRFPIASFMSLEITYLEDSLPVQDILSAVLPPSSYSTYSSTSSLSVLKALDLQVRCGEARQIVTLPYGSLSNLEDLDLTIDNIDFAHLPSPESEAGTEPCLPALRSLTFNCCLSLDRTWVRDLLWRLKRQGNVPQIAVVDCQWKDADEDMDMDLDEDEDEHSGSSSDDDEDTLSGGDSDNVDDWEGRTDDDDLEPMMVTEEELLSMVM